MLTGNGKRYTKEEELEYGRVIKIGNTARELLNDGNPLTKEKRIELERQVEAAESARFELFDANVSFANKLASDMHRRTGTNYPLEDLAQDAYSALYDSTDSYDPNKDCVLRTHAYYKITKALSVTINKMRTIRLPENKMGDYLHITRAEQEFSMKHSGVFDTDDQRAYVVEQTGISNEMIALIKNTMLGAISLNAPLGESGGEFGDLIKDEDANTHEIENPVLSTLIGGLSQFDQDIIAFELQVGSPSMKLSDFMVKYNMDAAAISKAAKKTVRSLKKQVSA